MPRDWMPGRPSWLPRRLGNVFATLVALLAVLAVAGFCYEQMALAKAARRAPPAAEMIDVGGYRLHLKCAGAGSPVVVMDGALGESMRTWDTIWPDVAKTTRVCRFDRAGLGWSDAGPLPRTSGRTAGELKTLLERAHVDGPFVVVGHSLGGLNMRVFAGRYPTAVAGIVLVDSPTPEVYRRMPPKTLRAQQAAMRKLRWLHRAASFGLPRALGVCGGDDEPHCRRWSGTVLAEWDDLPQSSAEVAEVHGFGATPLMVLSADPKLKTSWLTEEERAAWDEMQLELLSLSSNSSRVIAQGSHHFIQQVRPDVVIAAIGRLVTAARASGASKP